MGSWEWPGGAPPVSGTGSSTLQVHARGYGSESGLWHSLCSMVSRGLLQSAHHVQWGEYRLR